MQAPCTNQARNSLKLITKMWLTQPLLYSPIFVQVLKKTMDSVLVMSTFSLCLRNKSEVLRTWQSNVAIKRVITNDWNKQSDADLLHSRVLRQYTNICAEAPPSDQALSGPEILLVWLCYKGIASVIRTINTSPLL